jgi:hypothetical protein
VLPILALAKEVQDGTSDGEKSSKPHEKQEVTGFLQSSSSTLSPFSFFQYGL